MITAANGTLTVTGIGGGAGSGAGNFGVYVTGNNSVIKTTGTGNLFVYGTGGNANGSGNSNAGVDITSANGIETTGGGNLSITGNGSGGAAPVTVTAFTSPALDQRRRQRHADPDRHRRGQQRLRRLYQRHQRHVDLDRQWKRHHHRHRRRTWDIYLGQLYTSGTGTYKLIGTGNGINNGILFGASTMYDYYTWLSTFSYTTAGNLEFLSDISKTTGGDANWTISCRERSSSAATSPRPAAS